MAPQYIYIYTHTFVGGFSWSETSNTPKKKKQSLLSKPLYDVTHDIIDDMKNENSRFRFLFRGKNMEEDRV